MNTLRTSVNFFLSKKLNSINYMSRAQEKLIARKTKVQICDG